MTRFVIAVCFGLALSGVGSIPGAGLGIVHAASPQFIQVSAGGAHTCGVKTNYSVVCWGDHSNGAASPPTGCGPAR